MNIEGHLYYAMLYGISRGFEKILPDTRKKPHRFLCLIFKSSLIHIISNLDEVRNKDREKSEKSQQRDHKRMTKEVLIKAS